MEIRSHKSLENDGVLHQEDLPIDRVVPAIDRLRICLASSDLADRSAAMPRSIGAVTGNLLKVRPIDRWYAAIDRRLLCLFRSFLEFLSFDRLLVPDRSAMARPFSLNSLLLKIALFCVLFHLDFRTCA